MQIYYGLGSRTVIIEALGKYEIPTCQQSPAEMKQSAKIDIPNINTHLINIAYLRFHRGITTLLNPGNES